MSCVFSKDPIGALQLQADNSLITTIISIEDQPIDLFWKHPLVLSALNENCIVVRLISSSDQYEINQVSELYPIGRIPCLLVFCDDIDNPKILDPYPSINEFYGLMIEQIGQITTGKAVSAQSGTVRISAQWKSQRVVRVFDCSDTVKDVKQWIFATFGPEFQVRMGHNGKLLPSDDSMTVVEAELAPSSALLLEKASTLVLNDAADLPDLPERHQETREVFKCSSVLRGILSLVNPFPGAVESEDFFTLK